MNTDLFVTIQLEVYRLALSVFIRVHPWFFPIFRRVFSVSLVFFVVDPCDIELSRRTVQLLREQMRFRFVGLLRDSQTSPPRLARCASANEGFMGSRILPVLFRGADQIRSNGVISFHDGQYG